MDDSVIRTLPGVRRQQAEEALESAKWAFENVRGGHTQAIDRFNAYVSESNQRVRLLGSVLAADEVQRLILTPHYWALQNLDPATKTGMPLASIVDLELGSVITRLDTARAQLAADARRFEGADIVVVPDTNVYVHHTVAHDTVPWSTLAFPGADVILAVPMLVVDELDRRKRDHKPIDFGSDVKVSTRARTTLKSFETGFFKDGPKDLSFALPAQPHVTVTLWIDDPDRERLADPDTDIVDTALAMRDLSGLPLVVVSKDTGMRFRARAAGLKAEEPPV